MKNDDKYSNVQIIINKTTLGSAESGLIDEIHTR